MILLLVIQNGCEFYDVVYNLMEWNRYSISQKSAQYIANVKKEIPGAQLREVYESNTGVRIYGEEIKRAKV